MAPISPQTREGLDEEIDGLRRQVEALKNEITKLKDAREQTAQTIAALRAAEQESHDPVPSTYWYSEPVALSVGIESQSEREGIVPLPRLRQPPVLHCGGLSSPRTAAHSIGGQVRLVLDKRVGDAVTFALTIGAVRSA